MKTEIPSGKELEIIKLKNSVNILRGACEQSLVVLEDEYDGAPDSPTRKNGSLIFELKQVLKVT